MNFKIFPALVLAAAVTLSAPVGLQAQSDDPAAERIPIMRSNGMVLRGAPRASGDEAIAAAQTFVDNFAALPALFEDPAFPGNTQPAAWDNFDAFVGIFDEARQGAEAALAAAQAGDMNGYSAGIQTVAATCSACHGPYRRQ